MTDERMATIEKIFAAALEQDPEDRDSLLERECAGDDELLDEVRALLQSFLDDPDFLEKSPASELLRSHNVELSLEEVEAQIEPGLPFERLGDFRLIKKLGAGGLGVVYLAVQESLQRKVALKLIRPELAGAPEVEERFWREIDMLAKIDHPHIVSVFGSGESQGTRYFAMELLQGKGLNEILRQAWSSRRKPSTKLILTWIKEIAEALDWTHQVGIIHRDVKPSNIHVLPGGRAKLLDFGIARNLKLSTLTFTGEMRGTPAYASPEQITGRHEQIDARTDIYSLGATLYEALTGKQPFDGESTEQVIHQVLNEDPLAPRRLNPSISRELERVILKALEKDPAHRYQKMADLAYDLTQLIEGGVDLIVKPASIFRRGRKTIRRHPAASTAIGVTLLAALAIVGYILFYSYPQTNKRLNEIQRLSDSKVLRDLSEKEKVLWPARPENLADLQEWLRRAEPLAGRLPVHQRTLADLQARTATLNLDQHQEEAWQLEVLRELVAGIGAFTVEDEGKRGALARVEERFALAGTIKEKTVDQYREAWRAAIASIADVDDCPAYDGLVIEPQVGLVPLGPDPRSGLWEFAHYESGEIPERCSDGNLAITEESAIVLVLIPSGTFDMGAIPPDGDHREAEPNVDPMAEGTEGPVHTVMIAKPFLLSKYEITQGQWWRKTGGNPSFNSPTVNPKLIDFTHPVEQVNWTECTRVLFELGLRLPSEAEWEYAARAGTSWPWWTGPTADTIDGAINMVDLKYCEYTSRKPPNPFVATYRDGYAAHAPVNALPPNPFGLHHVIGNVSEWCQDIYVKSYGGGHPTDGNRHESLDGTDRVVRGGSCAQFLEDNRVSKRMPQGPESAIQVNGVRPACDLIIENVQ